MPMWGPDPPPIDKPRHDFGRKRLEQRYLAPLPMVLLKLNSFLSKQGTLGRHLVLRKIVSQ
jgi:hypothetical protein